MKTPEEWADLLISNQIKIVKEIQKEAYNKAIDDMVKQVGDIQFDKNGIIKK